MRRRTRAAAIAALAGIIVLSGCQNLPKRTAGTRCKLVGEHAQDGTWVLKCGANKRWGRVMTIAQANQAIGDWLRSQVPPTTTAPAPTTTAPPPALTSFSGVTTATPVANRSGAIQPGRYWTSVPVGTECVVESVLAGDRRLRGSVGGPLYIDLSDSATVRTSGPCTWTRGEPGTQAMPGSGDGMYRVGREIQPGLYTAPGAPAGEDCYWETATDASATLGAVTGIYYGTGPQIVSIESTDAFFVSDACGLWTPLTTLPASFLSVASSTQMTPWQGHSAFYQPGQFTWSAGAGAVSALAGGYAVTVNPTSVAPFTVGTFSISRTADVTRLGVSPIGPGGSCTTVTGTGEVLSVTLDADDVPTALHVVIIGNCDGKAFGVNLQF